MSQWFMFYQAKPESEWLISLSLRREALAGEGVPFVTVLDVDNPFDGTLTPDEKAKVRYRGPAYFDFDAANIVDAIEDTQKFVSELIDKDVDPECLELYLTGGRGFHIEIPPQVFLDKPRPHGIVLQPLINRELAFKFQQDSLDLRIYSLGRGRMWRTTNVKRPNGLYKVPITYTELMGMTEEKYQELASAPRMAIPRRAPTLAGPLATMWATAAHKLETMPKKSSRKDGKLISDLKGEWSPSMKKLLDGEMIEPGVGFQKVATQLAITAHALGKSQDEYLKAAENLCLNYQGSDSNRYNTYSKRVRELTRMYHYMADHPSYTFSVGGLRSIMVPGSATPDLVTTSELTDAEMGALAEESKCQDMSVNYQGVAWRNKESGEFEMKCRVGLTNPRGIYTLTEQNELDLQGLRLDVHVGEVLKKHQSFFPVETFYTRGAFQKVAVGLGAHHDLTDYQVPVLMSYFSAIMDRTNRKTFSLRREGLNIVRVPARIGMPDTALNDVVWASPHGCFGLNEEDSSDPGERRFNLIGTGFGVVASYKSDLMNAPRWMVDFKSAEEQFAAGKYFTNLVSMNAPHVIGAFIGWFSASHFAPFVREGFQGRFPFLHPYGEAGSGKSQTALLISRMFYHRAEAPLVALGSGVTKFSMESKWTASSSIPLIFDEYKPRAMRQTSVNDFKALARSAYQASEISKGSVNRMGNTAASALLVQKEALTAPMVYIAEAKETETALEERSVPVLMSKLYKGGKLTGGVRSTQEVAYAYVSDFDRACKYLGAVGKHLALAAQRSSTANVYEEITALEDQIRRENPNLSGDDSRRIFGMAVVRWGLRQFWQTLQHVLPSDNYPDLYRTLGACEAACTLQALSGGGSEEGAAIDDGPRSELTKVLDTMAFLSILDEARAERAIEGLDYFVVDAAYVDVHIRLIFDKYQRYCKSSGNEEYFQGFAPFAQSLRSYAGLAGKAPPMSPLVQKHSTADPILRLKRSVLAADGVMNFRTLK